MEQAKIIGLVNAAHGNAIAKGWWEKERTLGELVSLIHTEASEAMEDFRNGKGLTEVWYEYKKPGGNVIKIELPKIFGEGEEIILGKPCGIPSELADIVIRVFDLVGKYDEVEKFATALNARLDGGHSSFIRKDEPFGDNMGWLHVVISKILTGGSVCFEGAKTVHATYTLAEYSGIDLDAIIAEKMAYNATRPHRHGGKVL